MTEDQIAEAAMLAGLHRVPLHLLHDAGETRELFTRLAEMIATVRARALRDHLRRLIDNDRALRDIARDLCSEYGFPEPPQ